jgi:hypothetical protein
LLGQGSNLEQIFNGFCGLYEFKKTLEKLTDQPGNLIPLDRGGVPDLSVSGDKFDLVEVDPHDPTMTSEPVAPMQSLNQLPMVTNCRMGLPGPTTSVGTRTDYSVGPWDYPACATRHLMAWSTRTTEEKYSVRKLYMSRTVWKAPRRTRLVLSPYSDL